MRGDAGIDVAGKTFGRRLAAIGVLWAVFLSPSCSPRTSMPSNGQAKGDANPAMDSADAAAIWSALGESERRQLQDLAKALAASPDREELEATMVRYARWLDTLTPSQRSRLELETSLEGRLRAARELVAEQRSQLQQDLRRLHEYERAASEQSFAAGLASGAGALADFQRKRKQLQEKMSSSERRNLGMLRIAAPKDANWYSMILGIKYGAMAANPQTGDWIPRFLPDRFRETPFYLRTFGGQPFADLTTADRARLRELLELSFTLPAVTPKMALTAYPRGDTRRLLYEEMTLSHSNRPFALVYLFDHPDQLFGEKKQRFEALLKPGSVASTAADERPAVRLPVPEAMEKLRRAGKKAAKDAKDG